MRAETVAMMGTLCFAQPTESCGPKLWIQHYSARKRTSYLNKMSLTKIATRPQSTTRQRQRSAQTAFRSIDQRDITTVGASKVPGDGQS